MNVTPLLTTRKTPGGGRLRWGVFVVDAVLVNSARIELVISGTEPPRSYRLSKWFTVKEGGLKFCGMKT